MFNLPKDDKTYKWTSHIKGKMIYYRLSSQIVRSILMSPKRVEKGIASGTSAAMKRHDTAKRKEELWLMYKKENQKSNIPAPEQVRYGAGKNQNLGNKIIMISAWRYPGVSRPGKEIPIPNDIREELGL